MTTPERRTVAILFSDLSGFTSMSESLDPEDVRDMIDALFQRFRTAIAANLEEAIRAYEEGGDRRAAEGARASLARIAP